MSKPIWIRLRSVLERDADATSVELSRESAEEMLAEIKRLTAEVAEYEAMFDAQWNADMAGVQMWREAHPGNDMVLPDRKRFTAWILAEIVVQRAENEKLRAALVAFADHFGPLEDNHMLHEDARRCFALTRAALEGR